MIRISGKIPIHIYPFFWFLAVAIGWLNSGSPLGTLIWVGIIFVSVMVHEYGHALTAIAFGQRAHIDLMGFGGLTHRHGPKLKLWQEFLITLNGPLAGFLLLGVNFAILSIIGFEPQNLLREILKIMVYANLFWTVVNLLPVQPLDGGKLVSIVLEALFGLKGVKIALFLSIVLALAIGVASFLFNLVLLGALFLLMTFENFRLWQSSLPLTEQDQNADLKKMLKGAEKSLNQGNLDEAFHQFKQVREVAGSGVIYVTATEFMADILYEQGKFREGYELLALLAAKLNPESLRLLQLLAYRSGELNAAAAMGDKIYQAFPGYEAALTNSLCFSLLGEATPAIGWLQCAIRDGMPNVRAILSKNEFDKIRGEGGFQEILKQAHE